MDHATTPEAEARSQRPEASAGTELLSGVVVSGPVFERFISVLERLERRLGNDEGRMTNDEGGPGALLTTAEVAKRLGKSERDVFRLVKRGKLRKVMGLGKRTTRYRPADVERLLSDREEMPGRRRL